MNQLIWITPSIIIAAVIAIVGIIKIFQLHKEKNNYPLKRDNRGNGALKTLAISLAIGGIVFGTDRFIAYSFFGSSIVVSIIDILKNRHAT
ncbi:MAG: hypothetical protein P8Y18_04140 [Candidatus Bathyarchaeota archaeon]